MALRSDRSTAFGVDEAPKARGRRAPAARETYKLNVTVDKALKAPLKKAAAEVDKPLQALVQELVVGYLAQEGYITAAEARQIEGGR